MSRRNIFTLPVTAALALVLTACGEEAPADPRTQAPLVRTVTVSDAGLKSRAFTGVVAARVESNLGFRVAGKVQERLVDNGQAVKRGQLLMRVDPVDLKLAARAQEASVVAAKARAKQATDDEARYRDLRGTGAISDSTYDQAKAAADAAIAQFKVAEAQAELARNATRYTDLVADADGTVVDTLAEPGQVVNAGQIVVRVARAGAREALIQLPETLRPSLGSLGQATLFGKNDISSEAILRQLSDTADPVTRSYEARYVLAEELQGAPLGSTITIKVADERAAAQDNLQVPIGAVLDVGSGPGVWRVEGEPAKVSWRPVTILNLSDDSARVTGQIKRGDQIVALGAHLLHEGEVVRLSTSSTTAAVEGAQP